MSRRVYQRVGVERHHLRRIGGVPAAPGVNARWDNLLAGWKLDEESDGSEAVARVDTSETYSFTDTNTCESATGLFTNGVRVQGANTERLDITGEANGARLFDYTKDSVLTVMFWAKFNAHAANHLTIRAQDPDTFIQYRWNEGVENQLQMVKYHNGSNPNASDILHTHSGVGAHDGSFHMLTIAIDGSGNVSSWVDTNSQGPTGTSGSWNALSGSNAFLRIGHGGGTQDVVIDSLFVFSEAKDSDWVSDMYNSGTGRLYPN